MARQRAADYDAKRTAHPRGGGGAVRRAWLRRQLDERPRGALRHDQVGPLPLLCRQGRCPDDILSEHIGDLLEIVRGAAGEAQDRSPLAAWSYRGPPARRLCQRGPPPQGSAQRAGRLPEAQRAAIVAMERDIVQVVADTLSEINPSSPAIRSCSSR